MVITTNPEQKQNQVIHALLLDFILLCFLFLLINLIKTTFGIESSVHMFKKNFMLNLKKCLTFIEFLNQFTNDYEFIYWESLTNTFIQICA